jgi:hypothetical protein
MRTASFVAELLEQVGTNNLPDLWFDRCCCVAVEVNGHSRVLAEDGCMSFI